MKINLIAEMHQRVANMAFTYLKEGETTETRMESYNNVIALIPEMQKYIDFYKIHQNRNTDLTISAAMIEGTYNYPI